MRGRPCPEAWACRLLAKEPPVPERIGSKVLPIPTKSPLSLWSQLEALGEKQEPPRIYAGEVSEASEYPPPSMRDVGKRLGYHPPHLAKRFPDLCRMISERYLAYRTEQKRQRLQKLV